MVRREAYGTSIQTPVRRKFENLVLGDARRRGQTHQWMYDFVNLSSLLDKNGFVCIERKDFMESNIPNWSLYALELDGNGSEYQPHSLYVECRKPS